MILDQKVQNKSTQMLEDLRHYHQQMSEVAGGG